MTAKSKKEHSIVILGVVMASIRVQCNWVSPPTTICEQRVKSATKRLQRWARMIRLQTLHWVSISCTGLTYEPRWRKNEYIPLDVAEEKVRATFTEKSNTITDSGLRLMTRSINEYTRHGHAQHPRLVQSWSSNLIPPSTSTILNRKATVSVARETDKHNARKTLSGYRRWTWMNSVSGQSIQRMIEVIEWSRRSFNDLLTIVPQNRQVLGLGS